MKVREISSIFIVLYKNKSSISFVQQNTKDVSKVPICSLVDKFKRYI